LSVFLCVVFVSVFYFSYHTQNIHTIVFSNYDNKTDVFSKNKKQASEQNILRWAHDHGIMHQSFEELCRNPIIVHMVKSDLNAIGQGTFRHSSREQVKICAPQPMTMLHFHSVSTPSIISYSCFVSPHLAKPFDQNRKT
jgi:hypothetical protein